MEATKTLVLNAAEMTVHEASVTLADGASVEASVAVDEETERATVTLAREAPSGAATLHLRFSGVLNDQMRGFYRSTYEAPDGSTRRMATTQFEATDARRAFPCWDEPAVKAVFDVTLVVPDGLDAVSNMPKASEEPLTDGKRTVRFEPTPVMSTYLLVFIVGDIARVEATASNGTVVGVWTTRGKEELGRFALENSVRILDYMNEYFGIDYPLPKMDHIAIPDFAAGAMENWGAITYRETALLFDPGNSAAQARQRILEVVAHEMAHMWFGDLVTMECVGRPVAQRELRVVDGRQGGRPPLPRVADVDAVRVAGHEYGAWSGRSAELTPDRGHSERPGGDPGSCSTPSATARAAPFCGCSRTSWVRRRSAADCTTTSRRTHTATRGPSTCGWRWRARRASP